MIKLKIAFDIDFTMTTGENHKKVFEEKYPSLDFWRDYDEYPIESMLVNKGFEKPDYAKYEIYKQEEKALFGVSTLEPWFIGFYNAIKENPNVEIHFITARNLCYEPQTHKLFAHYNFPISSLHHLGGYNKEVLCEELGINILFEDHVWTLEKALTSGVIDKGVLVKRKYNQVGVKHRDLITIDPSEGYENQKEIFVNLLKLYKVGI